MIDMLDSLGEIHPQQIDALEKTLGYSLPASYRNFLLRYNGGEPADTVFFIDDEEGEDVIGGFYGICHEDVDNLASIYAICSGRMPKHVLPIAFDPFGNQICLSLAGDDTGNVYFWDHEREYLDGRAPDYHNLILLADSFDAFLASLRPDDDDEEEESEL